MRKGEEWMLDIWFSLLFYIAFSVYSLFGSYVLLINSRNRTNRMFFLVCLSLVIWTFSFSIANSANSYETVVFWRRVSAFGWGILYSFLLHYTLLFTHSNGGKKINWKYGLLYIPAFINIYIFGISSNAENKYQFIKTNVGWVNMSKNSIWDYYFNVYYLSFGIASLAILILWSIKASKPEEKKQGFIQVISFSINFLLGSFSDVIFNTYTTINTPQLAPVFAIIPISAIFYATKKYGLMVKDKEKKAEPGKILSQVNLDRIFNIVSIIYFISGLLCYVTPHFLQHNKMDISSGIFISLLCYFTSMLIQLVKFLKVKEVIKEDFFIAIIVLSLMCITLFFMKYASITVWAAPFIIIIISVLFNRKKILLFLGTASVLVEIVIWIHFSSITTHIDSADYIGRIFILSIGIACAAFVNRIYITRLEENERQIKQQKILSKISSGFVEVNENNIDEKIVYMLKMVGEYFNADEVFIFEFDKQQIKYSWKEYNLSTICKELQGDEGVEEKKYSIVNVPIKQDGEMIATLGLYWENGNMAVTSDELDMLYILENMLSNAMKKIQSEKEMRFMAYYDALTGLPNRKLFNEQLQHIIIDAGLKNTKVGVIFIDIDSFKYVNDTMGHNVGDLMLKHVAKQLLTDVEGKGIVARFGGDEFLIGIECVDNVEIEKYVKKILQSFKQPIYLQMQEFFVSLSIGISVCPEDGRTCEELIKNADLSMYASKARGKNQFTICSKAMKDDVLDKSVLTNRLFKALEKEELLIYYQPQVNVQTRKIVGVEALLRWYIKDRGVISPSIFIPIAEHTGLIHPIGEWVLENACKQWKVWTDKYHIPLRMAVNLSVEQFRKAELPDNFARILKATGMDPKSLELEVTESVAVQEAELVEKTMENLKQLGAQIAIDDFGTEYSSLNRIKTLPVDRIKIDMQFVRGILPGNKDEAITKVIIQLAKSLELEVIAEGVERENQYEFFKENGCDEIQGYYFYPPMTSSELEKVLDDYANE
jgi:diguanylate cyclase (GGDEF)-like protein